MCSLLDVARYIANIFVNMMYLAAIIYYMGTGVIGIAILKGFGKWQVEEVCHLTGATLSAASHTAQWWRNTLHPFSCSINPCKDITLHIHHFLLGTTLKAAPLSMQKGIHNYMCVWFKLCFKFLTSCCIVSIALSFILSISDPPGWRLIVFWIPIASAVHPTVYLISTRKLNTSRHLSSLH